MTFTANNGCTFCGSDGHMTAVCPWKFDEAAGELLDNLAALINLPKREHGEDDDTYRRRLHNLLALRPIAAQSAPDEHEAFEAAVAAVNERGWTTSTDLARQIWDSCAAWQRAQSAQAGAVNVPREFLEGLRDGRFDLGTIWQRAADLLAAAPQPAPREWPVVHTSVGCIACEGSPAGDNNPCHICGATQPAAPVAECTNEDSWNCKYCRKTETCAALKDERNFGAPPKAARQEQGE